MTCTVICVSPSLEYRSRGFLSARGRLLSALSSLSKWSSASPHLPNRIDGRVRQLSGVSGAGYTLPWRRRWRPVRALTMDIRQEQVLDLDILRGAVCCRYWWMPFERRAVIYSNTDGGWARIVAIRVPAGQSKQPSTMRQSCIVRPKLSGTLCEVKAVGTERCVQPRGTMLPHCVPGKEVKILGTQCRLKCHQLNCRSSAPTDNALRRKCTSSRALRIVW